MNKTYEDQVREERMVNFVNMLNRILSTIDYSYAPIWASVSNMKYERDDSDSEAPVWERVAVTIKETGEVIFVCITNDDYSEVITAITNAVNYYKEHGEYV